MRRWYQPQNQGCVAMYLAAVACDGHFDANAQRLPTVQRDTQEAKNMNWGGSGRPHWTLTRMSGASAAQEAKARLCR